MSLTKLTCRVSAELNVSQSTLWRVLRKRLQLKAFAFQMEQAIKSTDKPLHRAVYINSLVFTDEATFYLCRKVNRHILRFWGAEKPQATFAHERDSPKIMFPAPLPTAVCLVCFSLWKT